MPFYELIKNRRSIRQYIDRKIEEEKINRLTAAALMSPSSKNSKPWEFIIVENRDTLVKLSESRNQGS